MIELVQIPTILKTREYLNTKTQVRATERNVSGDFSTCKSFLYCSDCHFPVFADLATSNTNRNDFSSFIQEVGSTETLVATLTNIETGVETVIVDNTYGVLYVTGSLKTGVWGFRLDWRLVAIGLGFGNYTFNIKIDNVMLRGDFEEEVCYKLMPFSCAAVDGTVRLTTFKNGYIENGFDYTNLSIGDWQDQIRLWGEFTLEDNVMEQDNLLLNNREVQQIQTQVIDNYNLRLNELKSDAAQAFIKDDLLANTMYVDDYNRNNVATFIVKFVVPVSIEAPIHATINGTYFYNIKFIEQNQATVKRNF